MNTNKDQDTRNREETDRGQGSNLNDDRGTESGEIGQKGGRSSRSQEDAESSSLRQTDMEDDTDQ